MNHIIQYEKFNESLNRNQRMFLHFPYFLIKFLLRNIINIPSLNLRWSELKKKSNDPKFDPMIMRSQYNPSQIESDLQEIKLDDIPNNALKMSTIFRNWKFYLNKDKKHRDIFSSSKDKKHERDVVYISKEDIKGGDWKIGHRLHDYDVYSKKIMVNNKIPSNDHYKYPILVMVAKLDKAKESIEIKEYIEDIFLDMKDEYSVSTNVYIDKYLNTIKISIKPEGKIDPHDRVFRDAKIIKDCDILKNRIISYLSTLGYNFKSKIKCHSNDFNDLDSISIDFNP